MTSEKSCFFAILLLLLPLASAGLAAQSGTLVVRAAPGSAVFWEGQRLGTVPDSGSLTIRGIPAGRSQLGLRRDGQPSLTETVAVVAGRQEVSFGLPQAEPAGAAGGPAPFRRSPAPAAPAAGAPATASNLPAAAAPAEPPGKPSPSGEGPRRQEHRAEPEGPAATAGRWDREPADPRVSRQTTGPEELPWIPLLLITGVLIWLAALLRKRRPEPEPEAPWSAEFFTVQPPAGRGPAPGAAARRDPFLEALEQGESALESKPPPPSTQDPVIDIESRPVSEDERES